MKYTLTKALFNLEDKISYVEISSDLGTFSGETICREEDLDHVSRYFGCQIAEGKAVRKLAKAKVRQLKAQRDALQRALNRIEAKYENEEYAYWQVQMRREIKNYEKEIQEFEVEVKKIGETIVNLIHSRDVIIQMKELREARKDDE